MISILLPLVLLTVRLGADGQPPPDTPQAPDRSHLVQNVNERAAGRCVGNLVGISGVRMQCVIAEDGTARDCEILNPSPPVLRHQHVFHCIASRMTFTYPDGTAAVGESVTVNLGARLNLSGREE